MTASAPETHCAPETPVISESSEEHGLFLDTLISRINQQLGKAEATTGEFCPQQPQSFEEAGVSSEEVEKIICKLLSARGALSGRKIAEHVGLSFGVMDELLRRLKNELVLAYKNTAAVGDYEYVLTDIGRDRARQYNAECTYFGAAPVPLRDYIASVKAQSIANQQVDQERLRDAFGDLLVNQEM